MFSHIENKIQGLAIFNFCLGVLVSVILFVSSFKNSFLVALITLVVGCILSWVGSFIIYGFGEIIKLLRSIDDNLSE